VKKETLYAQLILITFITIIILVTISPNICNAFPSVEIIKVDYPTQVIAGEMFKINVTVNYSYE